MALISNNLLKCSLRFQVQTVLKRFTFCSLHYNRQNSSPSRHLSLLSNSCFSSGGKSSKISNLALNNSFKISFEYKCPSLSSRFLTLRHSSTSSPTPPSNATRPLNFQVVDMIDRSHAEFSPDFIHGMPTLATVRNRFSRRFMSVMFNLLSKDPNAFTSGSSFTLASTSGISMRESYLECVIPLSHDPEIQKRYTNVWNALRISRVLEDVDMFAGYVASNCLEKNWILAGCPPVPFYMVTLMMERLKLDLEKIEELPADCDLKLSGCVTWVGRSTIEVSLRVEQFIPIEGHRPPPSGLPSLAHPPPSPPSAKSHATHAPTPPVSDPESLTTPTFPSVKPQPTPPGMRKIIVLDARVLMAVRNGLSHTAMRLAQLKLADNTEERLFKQGELRNRARRKFEAESLMKTVPSGPEIQEVHKMFLESLNMEAGSLAAHFKPEKTVWLSETALKTHLICHPEERNSFNRIFGGYIMRQACELAFGCATLHCRRKPVLLAIDHFRFLLPVEIGAFLMLSSHVAYVTEDGLHATVRVHVEMIDQFTHERRTSNTAYFVFETGSGEDPRMGVSAADEAAAQALDGAKSKSKSAGVYRVLPQTYAHAVLYLQGKRHYDLIMREGAATQSDQSEPIWTQLFLQNY